MVMRQMRTAVVRVNLYLSCQMVNWHAVQKQRVNVFRLCSNKALSMVGSDDSCVFVYIDVVGTNSYINRSI